MDLLVEKNLGTYNSGTGNRKILIKAQVGSHNYLLNDKDSDVDWKLYTAPTFDDMYEGRQFATQTVTATEDVNVHDIRKLEEVLRKANLNFLEVLYSKQIYISDMLVYDIFAWRKRLVKMNIPYLFSACKGMHFNKMAIIFKGTEGTQHLVDKFGYDTKQALHAYRILDFCIRYHQTGFEDFEWAMKYADEAEKCFMLGIKHGEHTYQQYEKMVEQKMAEFMALEDEFKKYPVDEEMKDILKELIKNIVKANM